MDMSPYQINPHRKLKVLVFVLLNVEIINMKTLRTAAVPLTSTRGHSESVNSHVMMVG